MLEICIGNKPPYDIRVSLSQKSHSSKPSKTQLFNVLRSISDCSVLFAIHVAGSVYYMFCINKQGEGWMGDRSTDKLDQARNRTVKTSKI